MIPWLRAFLAAALVAGSALHAAEPAPIPPLPASATPTAEELAARERIRGEVERWIARVDGTLPEPGDDEDPRMLQRSADALAALGPAVVPFMLAEIDRQNILTFDVACQVLGRIGGPEAAPGLLREIERADGEDSKPARIRKLWAAYALASLGRPEAIPRSLTGLHVVAGSDLFKDVTLLEAEAVLTAPASIPLLLERLEAARRAFEADPEKAPDLGLVVDALAGLADPSLVPKLVPLLALDHSRLRALVLRALADTGDPSVPEILVKYLSAPEIRERVEAAWGLERMRARGHERAILARLEVETAQAVRNHLYRGLALISGDAALEAFVGSWGRPDGLDRTQLIRAVGEMRSPKTVNLLRAALKDPDKRPGLAAIDALGRISSPGASEALLGLVRDPDWVLAGGAVAQLARLGERKAAPRIAERMLRDEVRPANPAYSPERFGVLGDALVRLRYAEPLEDLRAILPSIPDSARPVLEETIRLLAELAARGQDRAKWIEAADSPDFAVRRLAYGRLAELGGAGTATFLAEHFRKTSVPDGVEILRALADLRSEEAAPLIERILTDPLYDDDGRLPLRSMAAWAARRLGTPAMTSALRRSAERREGRDLDVLVYHALLAGKDAVPLLRSVRSPRMKYFEISRGAERDRIDFMVRELTAGRSLPSLDFPPEEIALDVH